MKISVRIGHRVTSFKVRPSVLAMYYVLMGEGANPQDFILDEVNNIIDTWEGDSAKGLSGYVTDVLLERMLEEEDVPLFKNVMKRLDEDANK